MHAEAGRKFQFLRELASGGFGSVFLARALHRDGFSRVLAVKLLHRRWTEDEEIASRMRDEARLLGQLRHRNIVEVLDLTLLDGRVAILMEYLEGVDLRVVLEDAVARGELIPTRVALDVAAAVASALDAAYRRPPIPGEAPLRVIHRDIKPSNVFIEESGNPKVLDFGVARADFAERESRTEELSFGSIEYMAPERLFFEPESPASDVYSLGCTLFELLALERFGKAKLRPDQHEELIYRRLRYLLARHPVGPEPVRRAVRDLLGEMLAFDEGDRPDAQTCVGRLRAIARKIREEDTLGEWGDRVVRPLAERVRDRQPASSATLVDKVIEEDPRGLPRTPTDELLRGVPEDPEESERTVPVDDARWSALKAATLADIERTIPPSEREAAPPPLSRPMRSVIPSEPVGARATSSPAREPEAGRGRWVNVALAAGVVFFSGVILAAGVGVVLLGLQLRHQGVFSVGDEAEVSIAQAVPVEEEPAPAPLSGPRATFTSALDAADRLAVRCDEARAEGLGVVEVGGESLGDCTVTAFLPERRRVTAVVQGVTAREYLCFADGERRCEAAEDSAADGG